MIAISSGTLQRAIWLPKYVLIQTRCRGGRQRRRRQARGANEREIRGDLNRDCDFLSILPSREVILVMEIAIALRCWKR
ncbi:hypothetical protein TIFTF001_047060 [Ficus carica]|uniref:Uncharacterized protein n=1 Tax=Ficus carica TaxID=3494 RepID=A0AA87Z734_FICCA|nr:hypothetical protein TIFTF001_047060 [Ficus carica]